VRYLFGLVCVCALVGTLPLSVGAQDAEEGAISEPALKHPSPSSEPAPEDPALQLKLDSAGLAVAPSPLRTVDGYTLEEMDVRVRRAAFGIVGSAVAFFVGATGGAPGVGVEGGGGGGPQRFMGAGRASAATALAAGGAVGMIAAGILLGARKRKRLSLQEADYGRPRRVKWGLAQSRLVF
jgi:hypothetical protein